MHQYTIFVTTNCIFINITKYWWNFILRSTERVCCKRISDFPGSMAVIFHISFWSCSLSRVLFKDRTFYLALSCPLEPSLFLPWWSEPMLTIWGERLAKGQHQENNILLTKIIHQNDVVKAISNRHLPKLVRLQQFCHEMQRSNLIG